MMRNNVQTFIILALPIIIFFGGVQLMNKLTHRHEVTKQLTLKLTHPGDRKPLNERFGYDVDAVKRHWGALNQDGRLYERQFLELDLVFPTFYGGALAVGLLMAWSASGRAFNLYALLVLAPVVVTVFADWFENLILLRQLSLYDSTRGNALQADWISISSVATMVKWIFAMGSVMILICLALHQQLLRIISSTKKSR